MALSKLPTEILLNILAPAPSRNDRSALSRVNRTLLFRLEGLLWCHLELKTESARRFEDLLAACRAPRKIGQYVRSFSAKSETKKWLLATQTQCLLAFMPHVQELQATDSLSRVCLPVSIGNSLMSARVALAGDNEVAMGRRHSMSEFLVTLAGIPSLRILQIETLGAAKGKLTLDLDKSVARRWSSIEDLRVVHCTVATANTIPTLISWMKALKKVVIAVPPLSISTFKPFRDAIEGHKDTLTDIVMCDDERFSGEWKRRMDLKLRSWSLTSFKGLKRLSIPDNPYLDPGFQLVLPPTLEVLEFQSISAASESSASDFPAFMMGIGSASDLGPEIWIADQGQRWPSLRKLIWWTRERERSFMGNVGAEYRENLEMTIELLKTNNIGFEWLEASWMGETVLGSVLREWS